MTSSIHKMKRDKLLSLSLSELQLSMQTEPLKGAFDKLRLELLAKGISFMPKIWISSDWFCPDGVCGFALPFYLCHPKLLRLEKEMTGQAEGGSQRELMMLLRHETAHALDNAFHLRKLKQRQKLFGITSKAYPKSYTPNYDSQDYITHMPDCYGQSHPDEDWAETFAFWLSGKPFPSHQKGTKAHDKYLYLTKVFAQLKQQRCFNRQPVEELSTLSMTLMDYYQEKKKRLRLREQSTAYQIVKKELPRQGKVLLHNYLKKKEKKLAFDLAKKEHLPHNKSMSIIEDLTAACQNSDFYLPTHWHEKDLINLLRTSNAGRKYRRVIM